MAKDLFNRIFNQNTIFIVPIKPESVCKHKTSVTVVTQAGEVSRIEPLVWIEKGEKIATDLSPNEEYSLFEAVFCSKPFRTLPQLTCTHYPTNNTVCC